MVDTSKVRPFQIPPRLLVGEGASELVGEEVTRLGKGRVLVVTDQHLSSIGLVEPVLRSLTAAGIAYEVFSDIDSEPTDKYVESGMAQFHRSCAEAVVAVGGGSAIDTAKAIAVMAANPGCIADYRGLGRLPGPGVPLIAIPTTAGTGSEVTQFTIITDTANNVKMLIGSPYVVPQVALVDPLLTLTTPPDLTAATGVDALTHAIEAYVSVKAQPASDALALRAIAMLSASLRRAWANGQDVEARREAMTGALLAGMAFTNASVALVHGMSRPIGAYFHVAHGMSNAALLGVVTRFSLSGNYRRYADVAAAMGDDTAGLSPQEAAEKGADAVERLIADLRIPRLRDLGVTRERLDALAPQMARDAIASGSPGNNPRAATEEEIVALYSQAF